MDAAGVKKAVALRPITSPDAILPYLEELDLVLVMTVEPGFGGQAFMESQLDTIRQVRTLIDRYNPACDLEVDGGINARTVHSAVEAGANVLVAGSAVFGAADPAAAIDALRVLSEFNIRRSSMQYLPPAMEKLVEQFARLPGIGPQERPAAGLLCAGPAPGSRPPSLCPGHSGCQGSGAYLSGLSESDRG